MEKNTSGKIKITRSREIQKNGDIHILERRIQYDPVKKYTKVLNTRLIGVIPKDSAKTLPTRPKKTANTDLKQKNAMLSSKISRISMMDILSHIGSASGIDDEVYACADTDTAQKIISLARYLVATNSQSLYGLKVWQYNHLLPYRGNLSERVCHDLFFTICDDESIAQKFFLRRRKDLAADGALAYDTPSLTAFDIISKIEWHTDDRNIMKLMTLYDAETRQPVAFIKRPESLPDAAALENAAGQIKALGMKTAEIIINERNAPDPNFSELLQAGRDFIIPAETSTAWILPEIDKLCENPEALPICPFDPAVHGIMVPVTLGSDRPESDAQSGEAETCNPTVYLNIYFEAARKETDKKDLEQVLYELKSMLECGTSIDDLSDSAQEKVSKYLKVHTRGNKNTVMHNSKAIQEARRYHGFFVLVSSRESDPFECLREYRKMDTIDGLFKEVLPDVDMDGLHGQRFVQFIALCYYEYMHEIIQKLADGLGEENGDPSHDTEQNLNNEKALKAWIDETPLHLQLQWFDTVGNTPATAKLKNERLAPEIIARDNLYLRKLGVPRR